MSPACCLPSALRRPTRSLDAELLGVRGRRRSSSLWKGMWPGPAMKLAGPLAARSPGLGLRLVLALEIERHARADEVLQGRLIDLVAFVDVDGAPHIPVEAGVE